MKTSAIWRLMIIFVLVFALVACQPAAPKATPTKALLTYKDMTVGFIQTGSEGGWRAANTASFKETATQLGVNLKFYDAQNKLENQVSAFRNFIADKKVNVIILAALETTGWEAVLKEAKAAGKTVVIEDRRIDAPEDLYVTYIGSDFAEEGRKSAVEMCTLLKDSPNKKVVELVGNVGSSAAKDRGQGFREKMGDCGIEVIESQTGNWSATEGKAVMEAWLKKHAKGEIAGVFAQNDEMGLGAAQAIKEAGLKPGSDIQGVFAQNDEMALGAIQAIKEAGLKPGTDVKVISFDATAGAFKAMIAGDLNTTIECNPLLAPQVYEAALKALNGEKLPKWVPSQEGVFYAQDAATILPTRKY